MKPNVYELISIISSAVSTIIFLKCYSILSQKKASINIKSVIAVVMFVFLAIINNLHNQLFIRTLVSFCLFFLVYKIVFNDRFRKTFIITFILYLVGIVIDIITSMGLSSLKIIRENLDNNSILFIKSVLSIMNTSIIHLLLKINTIYMAGKRVVDWSKSENFDFIISIVILVAVSLLGAFNAIKITDTSDRIMILIFTICFGIFIIWHYKIKHDKKVLELKNKNLELSTQLYNSLVEDYRDLKHNMRNNLMFIRKTARPKVQELIDDKINELNSNNEIIANLEIVPDGLKDVFYLKLNNTENIQFIINCNKKENIMKKMKPRHFNSLIESLNIALDNSLEVIQECKEKILYIDILIEKNELTINIVNSFNSSIDLEQLGNRNYTTKKHGHGIGLNFINRNKYINLSNKVVNNKFHSILNTKLKEVNYS